MREFQNLGELIADLKSVKTRYKRTAKKVVRAAGTAIKKDAQALFGHYQDGWPELAEATKEHRKAHGYPENDPLLVTGALRDAVDVHIENAGMAAFVGVLPGQAITGMDGKTHDAAEIMGVHEYGTTNGHVPARPVFGIIANRVARHEKTAEDQIMKGLEL